MSLKNNHYKKKIMNGKYLLNIHIQYSFWSYKIEAFVEKRRWLCIYWNNQQGKVILHGPYDAALDVTVFIKYLYKSGADGDLIVTLHCKSCSSNHRQQYQVLVHVGRIYTMTRFRTSSRYDLMGCSLGQ